MQPQPADTAAPRPETLTRAPAHVAELLLTLIRMAPCRHADPQHCQAAELGLARQTADQIWVEAAHAGATWAMQRQPARMHITADHPDQLASVAQVLNTTTPTETSTQ